MIEPIQREMYEVMNNLARDLQDLLYPHGFVLLVFDYKNKEDRRMNYISNSRREDVLIAMKEFIAVQEGRVQTTKNNTKQ